MPRTSQTGSPRGFTLLELIVAMAIAGLVMVCIFGVFTGVSSAERRVQAQNDRLQAARFLLNRLDADLMNAIAGSENLDSFSKPDTEPLFIRTRSEQGFPGLVEYVFKDSVLTRTWIPDPVTAPVNAPVVDANEEPTPLSGELKMEIARGLDSWNWAAQISETQDSKYPQGIRVKFKWQAALGVPPLSFERLFRLEAQPAGAQ